MKYNHKYSHKDAHKYALAIQQQKKVLFFLFLILIAGLFSSAVNADTVLLIGDSHSVGDFGVELVRLLEESQYTVVKEARGGTNIQHWLQGSYGSQQFPTFQALVQTHAPDIVIIALGTNHLTQSSSTVERRASTLVSFVPSTTRCIWIGPAQVRENPLTASNSSYNAIIYTNAHVDQVYAAIDAGITGHCTLLDSRPYAPASAFSSRDGIHLPRDAAKNWARQIVAQLPSVGVPITGASSTEITSATRGQASASSATASSNAAASGVSSDTGGTSLGGSAQVEDMLEGDGSEFDPYHWNGGQIGMTSGCEKLVLNDGGFWIPVLETDSAGSVFNIEGDGTQSNPFKIQGELKGLACDVSTGVHVTYWNQESPGWSLTPVLSSSVAAAQTGAESAGSLGSCMLSTTNRCDTADFPFNNIEGDRYAYGCTSTPGYAQSCCKDQGGVFKSSFLIPTGTNDPANNKLLQRCGVLVASAELGTPSGRAKEIDDVWVALRGKLGLQGDAAAKVWHGGWIEYSQLYAPPSSSLSQLTKPTVSSTTYDEMIKRAARDSNVNVPAALLKAIIQHESGFDPWEISATGCVGLFQICTTSAKFSFIKKMSGVTLQTGDARELDGVRSCCAGAECSPYRAACGGSTSWCAAAHYNCDPANDDRFDPQRNIMSGALTVKGKINAIPEARCGLGCQIAAYNIGECVVKKALEEEVGVDGQTSWENVYPKITPQIMDECSKSYSNWPLEKKETKIKHLGPYVQNILNDYQQYQAAGFS